MRRKIIKKRIALIIILIMLLFTTPTFGRYIYNNVRDMYLKSRNFSFSSNFLTSTGKTYKYANWSGVENYEIDFKLYSYENELSLFTYEGAGLGYTLTCSSDDIDKATVHIGYTSGESTGSSYIPNESNIKDVKLYVKPQGNLNPGDVVTISVTAQTTVPFKKTLTGRFQIRITEERISYKIEDEPYRVYATLELLNPDNTDKQLKLTFNPELIMIDTTDEAYINRVTQTTTEKDDGITYVNSVTITLGAEDFKKIKFYKKDKRADYTYPNDDNESMIVTITN